MSPTRPNESPARAHTATRPSPLTKVRATAVAALALGAIWLFGAAPALAAGTAPTEQAIGLLFVQTASHGSFKPVKGEKNRFTLRLHVPHLQVVWFSDRPARHQGQIPIPAFAKSWKGFGFGADPPNAALTLLSHDNSEDTVVVRLGQPRYDKARHVIRYPARKLPPAGGNLADFESDNDGHVPRRFDDASLFIDDANGWVVNDCLIGPYASCVNAELEGAKLPRANLTGANLAGADLRYANLYYAHLTGAELSNAYLSGTDFRFADLSFADLRNATLDNADLTGADLTGADLSNPFGGPKLCHTTMPNRSINNSGC